MPSTTYSLTTAHQNALHAMARAMGMSRSAFLQTVVEALHTGRVENVGGRLFVSGNAPLPGHTALARPAAYTSGTIDPPGVAQSAGNLLNGVDEWPRDPKTGFVDFNAMTPQQMQDWSAQQRARGFPDIGTKHSDQGQPVDPRRPPTDEEMRNFGKPAPQGDWFAQRLASGNAPKAVLEELDPSKPDVDGQ